MMSRIFCWLCLCLLLNTAPIFAQNINNLHIERVQGDGLTNDFIRCMAQDANGFMWFGTSEGLFRYDGYNFKAFKNLPGDSTTLANNIIASLCPDKNKLWIATVDGLSCLDINTQAIKNYMPGNVATTVVTIFQKSDDLLWLDTQTGLYEFNKTNCNWKLIPGLDKHVIVSFITNDQQGHLYITTKNGFYVYDKLRRTFGYNCPPVKVYPAVDKNATAPYISSTIGADGNIWMTTWGGRAHKM